MITCCECIKSLRPDDPRVPTGRYHHSTCDYFCDKPDCDREIERQTVISEPRPIVNVTYQINARSTPAFKELEEKIALINGRLSKYFDTNRGDSF